MDAGRKCVFFDRDGIVNQPPGPGWVERWADFEWMPGFVEALRVVRAQGYEAVIATNQSGISRGVMPAAAVIEIHANLRETLRKRHDLDLLDILYCPHQDHHQCACRKPKPGLLQEAARRHGLDLSRSWMIGDRPGDVEAGRRAGCRTILVASAAMRGAGEDCRVENMLALAVVLKHLLR